MPSRKPLSPCNISGCSSESGRSSHVVRQLRITFGLAGGLCRTPRGSHSKPASQSAFTKPSRKASRKASRKPFSSHPRASARAISRATTTPGIFVVSGPVMSRKKTTRPLGGGQLSRRIRWSTHNRVLTRRYLATLCHPVGRSGGWVEGVWCGESGLHGWRSLPWCFGFGWWSRYHSRRENGKPGGRGDRGRIRQPPPLPGGGGVLSIQAAFHPRVAQAARPVLSGNKCHPGYQGSPPGRAEPAGRAHQSGSRSRSEI